MMLVDTTSLRQFISSVYPLKEAEMERFLEAWQPFECKRKTILTAAGETERHLYFVLGGVQRAFFVDDDDRQEATIVFTYPPSFSGVADSFLTQTPSKYFLERSEEHTSELQSLAYLVCRLLLEKKKKYTYNYTTKPCASKTDDT